MTELQFDPTKHTLLFGDASLIHPDASDYYLWSDLLDWESDATKSHHWESVGRFPKGDPEGRGGQFAPGGSGSVSTEEDDHEARSTGDSRWWNSIPWVRQITQNLGRMLPEKVDLPDYINFKFSNKEARTRFSEAFPGVSLEDVGRLAEGIDEEGLSATGFVAPWQKDRLSFEWSFWRGEGHKRHLVGQMAFWTGKTGVGQKFAELTMAAMEHNETRAGLGNVVMGRLLPLLKQMDVRHVRMRADITIGKYAWAKMGFEYVSPTLALRANQRFPEWASLQYLDEPAEGWPTFSKPIEWAKYSIPGVTLTGNDINNKDVEGSHVMHVGKAFMLDGRGHGDWLASLDLNKLDDIRMLFKSFPYKIRSKPFMRDEEPVEMAAYSYMFGRRGDTIPADASDLVYWLDWLINDETSSPIKIRRDISHVQRDERGRWIDTPGVGDDDFAFEDDAGYRYEPDLPEEDIVPDQGVNVVTDEEIAQFVADREQSLREGAELEPAPEPMTYYNPWNTFSTVEGGRENATIKWHYTGDIHGKQHPSEDRLRTLEDYGLSEEKIEGIVKSWDVDEKYDVTMDVSWVADDLSLEARVLEMKDRGDGVIEDVHMGDFNFTIADPEMQGSRRRNWDPASERTVHLGYGRITASQQGKEIGSAALQNTLMQLARNAGVTKAKIDADITIGRYAWAKRGFDYASPGYIDVIKTFLGKWVSRQESRQGVPLGRDLDSAIDMLETARDVATFDLPNGYQFRGSDIGNDDVPADMELHAGKAFMLDQDQFGHGEWEGEMYLGWLANKSQPWLQNIENRKGDGMTVKQAELPVVREGEPLEEWLQRSVPAITQQVGMSEQEAADVATEAWGIRNPDSAAQESFATEGLPPEAAPSPNGAETPEWEDEGTWGEDFGEEGLEKSPTGENVEEFGEEESFGEAPSDDEFFAAGEATPEPAPAEAPAPEPTAESDDDFWNRFFQSGTEEAPAEEVPPEEAPAEPVAEDEFAEEEAAPEEEPIEEEEEEEELIGTAAAAVEEEPEMEAEEEAAPEEDELEALADAESEEEAPAEEEDFEELEDEDDLDAELEDEEDLELEDEEDLEDEELEEDEEELEEEFA